MSLLREIQNGAVETSSDLESLLRKCRVLATRLKHEELKNWVQSELDGYPGGTPVPSYRKFHLASYGHFSGAFGSGIRNAPIPEISIPEKYRENLTHVEMRQGVSSLRSLAENCDESVIQLAWPANAFALFGDKIVDRMVLVQAWAGLPKNDINGILSTVRNRILSFALEIEEVNPEAGEAAPGVTPVPKETVTRLVNNNFYGAVGNVGTGEGFTQTATLNVQQGDFRTLAAVLKDTGIADLDLKDLEGALHSDPAPTGRSFGKRVSSWVGKMIQKSAEGTWKIGTTVAANLLTTALKSYYGMP